MNLYPAIFIFVFPLERIKHAAKANVNALICEKCIPLHALCASCACLQCACYGESCGHSAKTSFCLASAMLHLYCCSLPRAACDTHKLGRFLWRKLIRGFLWRAFSNRIIHNHTCMILYEGRRRRFTRQQRPWQVHHSTLVFGCDRYLRLKYSNYCSL